MTRLLDRLTWLGLALTVGPLLLWGGISVARLTEACNVSWWIAWIPAVATSGVMIAATKLAMTPTLDERIRAYAGWLSFGGILADILAAGAQHYLEARHLQPAPEMAAIMGGLPSLMGGLLVHIVAMVFAQARQEKAAAERAQAEAARAARAEVEAEAARRKRIADENEAHQRKLDHQRELAAEAARATETLQRKAQAERELTEAQQAAVATVNDALTAPLQLVHSTTSKRPAVAAQSGRGAPLKTKALRYLADQLAAGADIDQIRPADLDKAIGASAGYSKKQITTWRGQVKAHAARKADTA